MPGITAARIPKMIAATPRSAIAHQFFARTSRSAVSMCRLLPDPDPTCDAHDRTAVTGAGVFDRRQLGSSESRRGVSGRDIRNYSGYLVPTNTDIPKLETVFVGEFDEECGTCRLP